MLTCENEELESLVTSILLIDFDVETLAVFFVVVVVVLRNGELQSMVCASRTQNDEEGHTV